MKTKLLEIAEWANKQSDITEGAEREAYNYLGHYALIAAAHESE